MTTDEFYKKLFEHLQFDFDIELVKNIESNTPGSTHIELENGKTFFVMIQECEPEDEVRFFWKDLSGRGHSGTFSKKELLDAFAEEMDEDNHHPDCPANDGFGCRCDELGYEESFSSWVEKAEVGDQYTDDTANRFERIN